ncbi:MAG: choice-of-anchor D domain-containing protein, partial [Candidatus Latescibacterota bacterium]
MKLRFMFASIITLTLYFSVNVSAQQTVIADFDSNGAVDFVDFSRFISQFGLTSDSTRYQRAVDLNQDNAIDGLDAFLFADVFGNDRTSASLTVSTGPNTNSRVELEPTDNGFLVYLDDVSGIGGYRIVLTMPDSVKVRSVEDHFGIGLLPIRRTSSGTEIVGLVMGNRNLNASGLLAGITFTGDTTGVSVASVSLRGKRVNLGNQQFLGDRNTISATNIKRIPVGDIALRPRYFDLGEVALGDTRTRSFVIVNTFNNQAVLGTRRNLAFEISSSNSALTADPNVFGVLADTTTGLATGGTQKVTLTFKPTQAGLFQGILSVKTNRPERPIVRVHVKADVKSSFVGTRSRVVANFDTLKLVDYGDFDELITRFGTIPDSTKYDLDKDGVVDGDDAFLFADLLGGFEGRASYDTVRVITGANLASAVRVQSAGEELTVTVRDLANMGGYRLNLSYDTRVLDVRWAKDLAGGGMMPIRRTSTGAEVVGMGFGGLIENPGHLPLAQIGVRPLSGQANAASLVRVTGVVFRGNKGERDSVGAVHIGGNGLDASPRVVDFGNLRIGATLQKTFRVYNLGTASTAFQIKSSDSLVTTSPRSVGNLGPGRTWDVTVTYRSVAPGPFASTLTLSANDADTSAIRIGVKAFGAVVNVSPDSLVFADTFIGQNVKLPITVTNPNLTPFEIQDLRLSRGDTVFVVDAKPSLPLSVAPNGGTQQLTVRFNPLAQGNVRDTLRIVGKDTSFVIPLTGKGLQQKATLSSAVLSFGNVTLGRDTTLSVVVGNAGNVTYRIDSLKVGKRDTSFAYVGAVKFPDTLAVGRLDTLRVRFRPDTTGAKRDTLRIYGQDTTWAVALSGTGLPRPIIQPPPLEDVVVVTFGGSVTKSRNIIHFGKVAWGKSDTAKVRVQNRRSGNLTFRFSTTDSQVVVKPDSVQNLPPNQEWDVVLTITPKRALQTQSEFRITTNEVGDGVTSIILKSGGSNPVLSDSVLSFGKIGLGNPITKTVTLTNTGYSRLILDSLSLKADSNFALVNPPTLPLSIAEEGGKQTFSVRFTPRSRGTLANV